MNMDLDGYLNRQEINRFLKVTQPELEKSEVCLSLSPAPPPLFCPLSLCFPLSCLCPVPRLPVILSIDSNRERNFRKEF
jgi:hypothetical protein